MADKANAKTPEDLVAYRELYQAQRGLLEAIADLIDDLPLNDRDPIVTKYRIMRDVYNNAKARAHG